MNEISSLPEMKQKGLIPLENGGAWLLVDKPSGITSHDVIDEVRRITGIKKVGHAGTLDPMATGLLVIALGKATKMLAEGLSDIKRYRTTAKLGLVSPTGDMDADWTRSVNVPLFSEERIRDALATIQSSPVQTPPMVSALKRHGEAMYKLARRGWWLEREARPVDVREIEFLGYCPDEGTVSFEIEGGGGLYVRTVVEDLGTVLNVPAALTALRRLVAGSYSVDDALALQEVSNLNLEDIG